MDKYEEVSGHPAAPNDYPVTSDRDAIIFHFEGGEDYTVRPARPVCLLEGPPPPAPPAPLAPRG